MTRRGKAVWYSSVSLVSLGAGAVAVPAFAQDTPVAAADAAAAKAEAADGLNDVVVTARRRALDTAIERKRNADTVVDSVVADEAGRLPDNSITEVLQRVPGVSIVRFASLGDPDRFSAEGSGIQIRGLSGTTALLNGREIFAANGGSGISWGEVTPELMAAVDVYKSSTAERIEPGIGGAVDLRTKMPFDYNKPSIAVTATSGYGDASHLGSYSGSLLVTDTWQTGIGRIGVLIDGAYSKFNSASAFIRSEPYYNQIIDGENRYIPGGFDYGDEKFERTRRGFYGAVQWQPASNLTFFHTTFISNYKSNRYETGVFVVPDNENYSITVLPKSADATYDSNGVLTSASVLGPRTGDAFAGALTGSGTSARQENETRDFSQGFTWDAGRLHAAGALQYTESSADGESFGSSLSSDFTSFSFATHDKDLPSFSFDTAGTINDRSRYVWASLAYPPSRNQSRMMAANLDLSYDVGEGFLRRLEIGGRYANKRERDNNLGTYWAPLGRGWNGSQQRTLNDGPATDAEFYGFDDFFKGAIAAPSPIFLPSRSLLDTFDPTLIQTRYGYPNEDSGGVINPFGANDREGRIATQVKTKAAYVQARFAKDDGLRFSGNIGLRFVDTSVSSTGRLVFTANQSFYATQAAADADLADDGLANGSTGGLLAALTADQNQTNVTSYQRWLPSLNLAIKPNDQVIVRAAVNATSTMAGYFDLRATETAALSTASNANDVPGVGDAPGTTYPPIFTGFTVTRGNTFLKPTTGINFDLGVEWYQSTNLNLHLSGFHKILKDLILYGSVARPFSQTFQGENGGTQTLTGTILADEIYNAKKDSYITGFEVGGRKYFNVLPAPFDGIGVEANFTYIDSKSPSALAVDINGNPMKNIPIVGLSKYNYNIQLLYDRKQLSMRAAWSWRSKYLQTTTGNGTNEFYSYYPDPTDSASAIRTRYSLPVYADAYGQLDAGITYTVDKNFRINVQGTNLTNSVTRTLMDGYPGGPLVRSWFISDRRYEVGVSIGF